MYRTDKQFMTNPATSSSRIYIGSLPKTTVAVDLEEKFMPHGKVLGLVLQQGFAFIQYEEDSQAQSAIDGENGSMLHGRKIVVKQALDKGHRGGPQQQNQNMNQNQRQQRPGGPPHQRQNFDDFNQRSGPPQRGGPPMRQGPPNNQRPPMNQQRQGPGPNQNRPNQQRPPGPPNKNFGGPPGPRGPSPQQRPGSQGSGPQKPLLGPGPVDAAPNEGPAEDFDQPPEDFDTFPEDNQDVEGPPFEDQGPPQQKQQQQQQPFPKNNSPMRDNKPQFNNQQKPQQQQPFQKNNPPMQDNKPQFNNQQQQPFQKNNAQMQDNKPPFNNQQKQQDLMDKRGRKRNRQRSRDRFPKPNFREENFFPRDDFNNRGGPMPQSLPPPIVDQPERNDCEIIVVSKQLTSYAEYIESRLKSLGLLVDLLFPNEDVPIGRVLANISSRGCIFAILVTPLNEEHRSLTLNILHGLPQEHRNMPLEDALILLMRNFDAYMRGDKTAAETLGPGGVMNLSDRHPTSIQLLLNLLTENRQLTSSQYDKLLKYLQERRELQSQHEVAEGADYESQESSTKQTELQNRIMNILNKSAEPTTPEEPTETTPALLHDPSVQKALDSLLVGDMFKSISGSS